MVGAIDIIGKSADDSHMRYPGGKSKCFQHIVNLLPPHSTYIETHLGGGAVLLHKAPAQKSIALDIDTQLIELWRASHPNLATYIALDATSFLHDYSFDGSEVIYCDPPYLPSTRKRSRVYRHELTSQGHFELLRVLKSIRARVIISGYPSDLYDSELRGWNRVQFTAKAHDGIRVESLWANYPLPQRLHDARYMGRIFRERQNIKRRLERLRRRISRLSTQEQHEVADWLSAELLAEKGEEECPNSRS